MAGLEPAMIPRAGIKCRARCRERGMNEEARRLFDARLLTMTIELRIYTFIGMHTSAGKYGII